MTTLCQTIVLVTYQEQDIAIISIALLRHPYLEYQSISQRAYPIKPMLFSISMRQMELPLKVIFLKPSGLARKSRSKETTWSKSENLVKRKKKILYQFFKTRICAFMTYGQFLPKSISNLRFVIRDSRVQGLSAGEAEHLEPLNHR